MPGWVKLALSAITQGIIAGGGVMLGSSAGGNLISENSWVIAGITALVAASKDVQSHLAEPPG